MSIPSVPKPTVSVTALNDQIVGNMLSLEYNAAIMKGVTSNVEIVWMKDDLRIKGDTDVTNTTETSTVYTLVYTRVTKYGS